MRFVMFSSLISSHPPPIMTLIETAIYTRGTAKLMGTTYHKTQVFNLRDSFIVSVVLTTSQQRVETREQCQMVAGK